MTNTKRKLPATMTADEFLAWSGDGTGVSYELVDGELRAMSPASTTHGAIQSAIARHIGNHLDVPGNPCRVVAEPAISLRVRANINVRVPDLGVSCAPDAPGQVYLPDPILLIEIISPGNKQDTLDNVWAYATVPTVREILLVQSTRIEAELLRRGKDGSWPPSSEVFSGDVSIPLETIGMALQLSSLYAKTHLA